MVKKLPLILLVILSISTGLVKILQMQEEMELFHNAGWESWQIILFGIWQLISGIFLIWAKTRKVGAWSILVTFVLATSVVFLNNMIIFGFFSILFIVLAFYVAQKS